MEIDRDDIRTLVERSSAGDHEAFHTLYEHMVDRIFRYVHARVRSSEIATDLTQDIFVALWKALPRFTYHSREQFYAYVFIITKRTLAKQYQEESRAPETVDGDRIPDSNAIMPGGSEEDLLSRALLLLDEKTREIMILHHWSRYTFGEIATLLGMQETAVRVRHHRGIETLRTYMDTHHD